VIVDDSQLSLAIGKKGQNVRLAAKLIGWKVDIKSEEEKRQEVQSQMEALTAVAPLSALQEYGLDAEVEGKLMEIGINTVEKLGEMTPEQLEEIPGIGADMVEKIQLAVINYYGQYDPGEAQQEAAGDAGAEGQDASAVSEVGAEVPVTAEGSESIETESDKMESPGSRTGSSAGDEGSGESGHHSEETM
jgi:N utilization substance protein A